MEYDIGHRPSYAQLTLDLEAGESVRAEAGAMVSKAPHIDVTTSAEGGVLKSLSRSLFGGESFFMNTFTASEPGQLQLAPALSGDVQHHRLDDETLYVQSSSFLASDPSVDVDTEFGGAKTFFGGEGLFLLRMSGTGPVFLSSYGAIDEHDVTAGESFVVDTGHIVAFEDSLSFDVRKVGGLKSTLFSGEGLVCEFEGDGRVWTQTRSPDAFLSWLIPKLPSRNTTTSTST
ncbi:TIGR00266 family protein [Halosimplex salinum]|uniref:TIGR00266 family protein n=1 Tax=Halosimplex salinum TaxID=1710538 RepID=UPI000F48FC15|nr:TIGR00266 family protein [Halosimplex salinum]